MNKSFSIYIHIPFCEKKCIYCDFASFVAKEDVKEKYFASLLDEIKSCKYQGKVRTIYIGGGTPSSVDEKYIKNILDEIRNKFEVQKNVEITIECNPNSATEEKLKFYKNIGINRISFGVQSLDDKILKIIGRLHNKNQAIDAIKTAKKMGFENISADIMIGLPGQTKSKLLSDAKTLLDLGINHISTYMLQLEEKAPLTRLVEKGVLKVPSDDKCVALYEALVAFLKKQDFERYEISNFAKSKTYSKHNLAYWQRREYLGFGLSAHSFVEGKRFANSKNMQDYLNRKNIECEKLSKEDEITEIIMLGLRCKLGFKISDLKKLGYDITKNKAYAEFLEKNILIKIGNVLRLNEDYYGVSNSVICGLLE